MAIVRSTSIYCRIPYYRWRALNNSLTTYKAANLAAQIDMTFYGSIMNTMIGSNRTRHFEL